MSNIYALLPFLVAMGVLIFCSAFFSASEAALFYLGNADRRALGRGNASERSADRLLQDPDRLLSAVLFWNLLINMIYFALSAIVSLRLERNLENGSTAAAAFAVVSLMVIIFFSEMLPKTFAVFQSKRIAGFVGLPLATAVRLVDPVMPLLRTANMLSQRLMIPHLESEEGLSMGDLDRAISFSVAEADLLLQEQAILQNIVRLSSIRVEEWMRPRSLYTVFKPPVSLADLDGNIPPSGYLLITEKDSDELEFAIRLHEAYNLPNENLEQRANRVIYAPWCTTVSDVLEKMRSRDRDVTAVINEHGETIGILTIDDILETIFAVDPSRSGIMLSQDPILYLKPGNWSVSGFTNLRRIAPLTQEELPETSSVTVGGVVQDILGRVPEKGDECEWGPFQFYVEDSPQSKQMKIRMSLREPGGLVE